MNPAPDHARSRPRTGELLAVGALVALQVGLSLWRARGLEHAGDNDTASYYIVARNLAEGRGLVDTALCYLHGHAASVVRPAGDYWCIGWPLILGSVMAWWATARGTRC